MGAGDGDGVLKKFSFLARLYEVYGELSYSPRRRRPRTQFWLKFWCSCTFFTVPSKVFMGFIWNFKYMFLIITHIIWGKVHNPIHHIFRIISPWNLEISWKIVICHYYLFISWGIYFKLQISVSYHHPHHVWPGS